jgi:hypothetical protein
MLFKEQILSLTVGKNTEKIKVYLLKYLVKSYHTYWSFSISLDGQVRVHLSTLLMWYFRVCLFFMSRLLKVVDLSASPGVYSGGRKPVLFMRSP